MPSEAAAIGAFAVAIVTVLAAVPLAIRVATQTGFYDRPGGYKVHPKATPYLGGAAVVAGISLAALVFIGADSKTFTVLLGAAFLLAVGTIDDRRTLRPSVRIAATSAAAIALWASGVGWSVFGNEAANLALTIAWVIGVVNAFNLMDNMDGAAASVAAVSGTGVAAVAVINDDAALAALALALVGACIGFLKYNLASPARIFLGDGGSMPIGFILAAAVISLPEMGASGASMIAPAAMLVGLAIFDTALVVVSRRRRGVQVCSGARDHVTHRLLPVLGSSTAVAIVLALVQGALCAATVVAVEFGPTASALVAGSTVAAAAVALYFLELRGWSPDRPARRKPVSPEPLPIHGRGPTSRPSPRVAR